MSLDFWAIVVFGITYIGIALGRIPGLLIDRTGIAIVGAIVMVISGALPVKDAIAAIDFSTILLLFGLMILSAQLRVAGFYRLVARRVLQTAHQPLVLLAGIVVASATLSSVFANDIVCLAFTPVICEALLAARRNPIPYLIALATSSNIGSVATLIGNPQNMFIGQVANLNFAHYFLRVVPIAILGIVANIAVVYWVWQREFAHDGQASLPKRLPDTLEKFQADTYLIRKTLILAALLLAGFLIGLPRDLCALGAAALLLPSRRNPAEKLYGLVDWNLIMLFLALFVVIGALQQRGIMAAALLGLANHGVTLARPFAFVSLCTVLSNVVSNVPAVLLMQSIPGESRQLWYMLAMASTLAGNLTILGSIANLIVVEKAAAYDVQIRFSDYFRIGVPLTMVTLIIGALWLSIW